MTNHSEKDLGNQNVIVDDKRTSKMALNSKTDL